MMVKILILGNDDGGVYKFRKELIEELSRKNRVYISVPFDRFISLLMELDCELIDTPIGRRKINPIIDLSLLLRYMRMIRRIKPDLVFTYTVKPNVYGGIVCRIMKVPYMANITGLGTSVENVGYIKKIVLKLYEVGLKQASCVFFQNESNQDYFTKKSLINSKTRLIPGSGVNLNYYALEEYPDDAEGIKFLFIGRIMRDKGINELLEAAIEIKKRYKDIHFNLVGLIEDDMSKKINDFKEHGIINYYDEKLDIRSFIRQSHAIILPSYHEGTSNVLLEAASSGRPVLASRVTGCRETLDEGVSGLCFEARNIDSLVQTIIKFIELPHERKEMMGLAGRKKMEKEYDRTIVVNAYIEEIEKVLKGKELS